MGRSGTRSRVVTIRRVLVLYAGNGDLSDLGRRFVECFVRAANDAGLPDEPEFRAALRAYMQWAVHEVLVLPG